MAWPTRRTLAPYLACAALLAWASSPARAGEAKYCVTCKNPDQIYLCQVTAGGKKPSDALKLYCVMRVAKEGQHSSCSAEKAKGPCNGLVKLYEYDGPMPEDIAAGVQHYSDKINDRIRKEQKAFEKPKSDQPDTLVKLTGRAVSAARTRIGRGSDGDEPPPPDDSLSLNTSPPPLPDEAALPPYVEDNSPNRAQRASSAVGGFARKSYRCMLSLFRHCSEDETLR
jgi:hypothetical protein